MAKNEDKERISQFNIIDGFRFGFGFFLAFSLGWVIVIVFAFIVSLIFKALGIEI